MSRARVLLSARRLTALAFVLLLSYALIAHAGRVGGLSVAQAGIDFATAYALVVLGAALLVAAAPAGRAHRTAALVLAGALLANAVFAVAARDGAVAAGAYFGCSLFLLEDPDA